MSSTTFLKCTAEPPARSDGKRVLVDRLWPRGKTKESLNLDLWLREIAPSMELRQWFGHDPAKWKEFRKRFFAELNDNPEPVATLRGLVDAGTVTLVFAARDVEHNNAEALREYLLR